MSEIGNLKKLNLIKIRDFFNFSLLMLFKWSDSIIIWFASSHALPFVVLNTLFKKKIFIIAGGYDVAQCPSINYGAMRFGYRRSLGQWILSRCDQVIAVSNSNKNEIITNANVDEKNIELIYNGVKLGRQSTHFKKKNQVLTVGEINEETILRKGLDRFLNVAKSLPYVQFIHIGKWTDKHGKPSDYAINKLKNIAPKNVKFLGFVKKDVLDNYFMDSKIYLQLSRHEAFGVSVVEAMNYNCVPIVSNAYALPEVVGNNGYIINSKLECIDAIKKVIASDKIEQININPLFDLSERKTAFRRLLEL